MTELSKSEWPEGPWHDEPDEWAGVLNGCRCAARRGPGGHWCGYVGLSLASPLAGLDHDEIDGFITVHGGLTYSEEGTGEYLPAGLYWFGFDCAHLDDLSPKYVNYSPAGRNETYRDLEYVKAELARMSYDIARFERLMLKVLEREGL